jgi:hypothetical protein
LGFGLLGEMPQGASLDRHTQGVTDRGLTVNSHVVPIGMSRRSPAAGLVLMVSGSIVGGLRINRRNGKTGEEHGGEASHG